MVQSATIGKTQPTRPMIWFLVLLGALVTAGAPAMTVAQAPPAAASEDAGTENPWRLLACLQPDDAIAAADGRQDALAVWVRTVAALRSSAEVETPGSGSNLTAAVARAAGAFETKDFTTCLAILDSLIADESLPAGPTQATFLAAQRGVCQLELGRIDEAEATLTEVLEAATAEAAPVLRCYALLSRGRERVRTRQVEPPRQDLSAARDLALDLDIPSWAGTAAIALSVVSRLQMDLDDALQWREQALVDFRRAGDVTGQARALHYIATIRAMQGDLTRALTMLQEALVLARQDENPAEVGGILGEMAGINYLLGNFDQALTEYEEAARLVAHPWRRGMMLSNMGSIHEYRGRLDEAARVLAEARDLLSAAGDKRSEALALTTLGKTLCAEQDFNAGLAALDEALDLAREFQIPMAEAYALATRGHGLLAKGDLQDAAAALAAATGIARRIDYFDVLEWSLLGQAQVARRLGQSDTALTYLDEALADVAERRRRSSGAAAVTGGIVQQAGRLYNETVDLLYELHAANPDRGLDDRAFAVAQQAKGRAFLDLLTEAEYDLRYSAVPGYREQESEILSRIVDLEEAIRIIGTAETTGAPPDSLGRLQAELAGAETELRLLEAQLRQAEPRYAEVLYPASLTRATLATKILAPGEVFLDYALGDSASYLWVVDREQTAFLQLPPRAEIDAQVREVLPLLTDYNLTGDDPAWYQPAAYALYRTLLLPAAAYLERAERLIISPDGILHYLSFEALPTSAEPVRRFRDVPYLIDRVEVGYTPTAGVLARLRASRSQEALPVDADWLLVGDPILQADDQAGVFARAAGATDLPPLPHAAAELAALAELAPAGHVRTLAAADACGATLTATVGVSRYSLVHFATHGLFNEQRPRYSGLVISPGAADEDDGFLSVSEVLGLRLPCDQVVLSACASALGETITGEGVASLTQSFMFAGARSVVAALWNVPDEATAALMVDYYRRLAVDPDRRITALAEVKRHLADGGASGTGSGADWSHPAFWAAFVLNGDSR